MIFKKLYLFIVIKVILCAVNGHKYKSSLVFVIDRTSSMHHVIEQVKQETDKIFDAVLNSNSSRIEDFILVAFDDPKTEIMCLTKDKDTFKEALYSIKLVNGGNCPEYSMSGIEEALKISRPNSFFYVFTDATAADYEKISIVRNLSQKKAIQVNFLMTGMCKKYRGKYFAVYEDLTEATSGQIFHIKRDDTTKIIKYIVQSVKDKWTILKRKITKKGEKEFQFIVDSKIKDVMIAVSSTTPNYRVIDSEGKEIKRNEIVQTEKSAIDKIIAKPGVYTIIISDDNTCTVLVSGATTVCFQYGFSSIEPTSLSETSTKPINGSAGKQYLSIELDNNERDVHLEIAELRDTDDNVIKNLTLKIINEEQQFYVTEPFKPPNGMFKIAINGLTKSKEKIIRVSTSTTEYQDPKLIPDPPYTPPTVTILSESKVNIDFDDSLSLKCKVNGCPEPNVAWTDDSGSILPSKPILQVDFPCDYISVLEIEKVNNNMTLTCTAVSTKGDKDAKTVEVKTKRKLYLKIIEYPKDKTVEYTKSVDFKCLVDASPLADISWFKESDKISNDKYFTISPDSSILTIKYMNPKVIGNYYVNISNTQGTKIFPFKVAMSGTDIGEYTPPSATIFPESPVNVDFDAPLTLQCKVHAYPKPDIIWTDESGNILSSEPVTTVDFPYEHISVLKIDKVNKNMILTCTTVNVEDDKDAKSIEVTTKKRYLKILEYPKDKVVEYKKSSEFKCKVDSLPEATITWFKHKEKIINDKNFIISSDSSILTIKEMHPELKGNYYVNVSNSYEYKIYKFKVTMFGTEVPKIEKSISIYKRKIGHSVDMSCRIIHGKPDPVILWSFSKDGVSTDFEDLSNTESIYHIDDIRKEDSGFYRCEASNEIDKDVHEMQLIVEYPPSITVIGKTKFEKGETVTLDCIIDGIPKPTIQWFFKKNEINVSSKYKIFKNNSLSFIGSLSDSGTYRCQAENSAGKEKKNKIVHIYEPVFIEPPEVDTLELDIGSNAILQCRVHGRPKPNVKWTVDYNSNIDSLELPSNKEDHSYKLQRVQTFEQGNYTCTAENIGGIKKITYQVYVLEAPTIEKQKLRSLNGVVGDLVLRVPCKASGFPTPTIIWKINGLNIAKGTDWYDIEDDGTLMIKNLSLSSQGSYVCTASNKLDYDTVEYDVNIAKFVDTSNVRVKEYLVKGSSKEILCGNNERQLLSRTGDYVRWFKDGVFHKEGELFLSNAKVSESGVYTCRVSNFKLSYSFNKKIIIGFKPEFISNGKNKIDFKEGAKEILDCRATGEPKPTIKWLHKLIKLKEESMLYDLTMTKANVGKYKCIIKNDFGDIQRTFEVISEACFLPKENDLGRNKPLILSHTRQWLLKKTMPTYTKIYILCPGTFLSYNGERLGGYILATCENNTLFEINGRIYDISKMKCNNEIQATYRKSGIPCRQGNTELVEVGFSLKSELLSIYDVCIDKDKFKIHFTKYGIHPGIANTDYPGATFDKSDLLPLNFDDVYDCEKQLTSISATTGQTLSESGKCCFGKRQLISPMDVLPGLPQAATYCYLNVVPVWSSCGLENWDEVERRVRSLVMNKDHTLEIWTGSSHSISSPFFPTELRLNDRHNYQQEVPLYIWKVILDRDGRTSLAIVLINFPNLMSLQAERYMNCKDVCHKANWMNYTEWHNVKKGFVYCCTLREFEANFKYEGLFKERNTILQG